VYKKGKLNKNCDALSRIELNMNELNTVSNNQNSSISQEIENRVKILQQNNDEDFDDIKSVLAEPGDLDNQNDDDHTVHSNLENPILSIPIIECPVNHGQNQLVISEVNFAATTPTIINLHKTKQRILIQIAKNNFEQEVINFVKNYIVPKVKYYAYFEDPIYEKFATVLQRIFKNSEINIIRCTKKLIDITSEDEITQAIMLHHEGKTNHRGIDETEKRIKNEYLLLA